ncbi:MAG: hypothetical protein K0Q73_9111 [Paenibacillus sp.]|nr:hypothetical protein [Paenibacillus sp.]
MSELMRRNFRAILLKDAIDYRSVQILVFLADE